jgi:type III pantothenate kinase
LKVLAVDIGNSNIVLGLFHGQRLVRDWRISTRRDGTRDEYSSLMRAMLSAAPDSIDPDGSVVSCVVPELNDVFSDALCDLFGSAPLMVGPGTKTGVKILTDNPREVGADRIVNALAAYDRFKGAAIIVDFGTAVTIDYVTPAGEYAGGAIAPGITISTEALFKKAAKLPRVSIARPASIIGKNTADAMRAGIYYGFAGLVDGVVERMAREAGTNPKVIATGGISALIAPGCRTIDETDEFLTLKGLRLIYEANRR